ncbi:MAG TPA: 1,4-alpha-glucan branching protein GlgB [Ardenticatenaceae bacterium]|jgi:1,4-alpha-glucan branching enzyme
MATITHEEFNRLLYAYHHDPFQVLGIHSVQQDGQPGVVVRAFRPEARDVSVVRLDTGEHVPMQRMAEEGYWEATFPGEAFFPYELELFLYDGQARLEQDPYRFGPLLSDFDLQLLGEGNHHQSYNRLGAHPIEHEGVPGVAFAVWAPNAQGVSIVGNFNGWDRRRHPMRVRGGTGIWELFIPNLQVGELYKYYIHAHGGIRLEKADPYGFASELRPNTASKVWNIHRYQWSDAAWMEKRAQTKWLEEPVNIYEVYLPSWARSPDHPDQYLNYRDLAHRLVDYVTEMGYTHIELLPVTEYPYDGSWGYQVTGYFSPTSRLGTPDDFMYFVDYCHQHDIAVLMDWVPAHFPKDPHGLARFDGTALYEYADPRMGEHRDWGTYIFNYSRNEVRNFLISSAVFWLDHYHIDGLRVDAVASMLYLDYSREPGQWVPNAYGGRENLDAINFLQRLNEVTHQYHPGIITVAEESTSYPMVTRPTYIGGLGFDFKWNMGWMNDTLKYIQTDPIYRKFEHTKLTFGLMYAFSENFILPISHDEVVHLKRSLAGKMPGDYWQQMANLRLFLGFMFTHPGKKLLFMGQDIGQWAEFSEDRSVDWHLLQAEQNRGANRWLHQLLHLIRNEPALYEQDHSWEGFKWIDANDWQNSIISYVRYAKEKDDFLVVIHNFTPVVRHAYHIGVPAGGTYHEVLNSDATEYWGSGVGNYGQCEATDEPWMGFEHSLFLTLPPLSTLILKPTSAPPRDALQKPEEVNVLDHAPELAPEPSVPAQEMAYAPPSEEAPAGPSAAPDEQELSEPAGELPFVPGAGEVAPEVTTTTPLPPPEEAAGTESAEPQEAPAGEPERRPTMDDEPEPIDYEEHEPGAPPPTEMDEVRDDAFGPLADLPLGEDELHVAGQPQASGTVEMEEEGEAANAGQREEDEGSRKLPPLWRLPGGAKTGPLTPNRDNQPDG